ncbi:putative P-loop containing nucleoside triphosphate hydrolase, leucine-rich repeat domain superfamily [Helianthus annuus]|nr:putative P-loop containing nucleoside triphosphate hydrolase, leucine-rich repeat domain superfamily [Helianthus annuus]
MGEVGKTTQARLLYNITKVKAHFELKAWVCVSDDFDIYKISKTLFQAASREKQEFEDLNQLQMALTKQFMDKRFLLVLDDVWNENYDEWEDLVRPLHVGALGSRIIMTTRKKQLLKMIGFDHVDHLESLSDTDTLSLLAQHALGVDNFDLHPTLKQKGECIVEKCGGLPLALKAIGRLLRTKSDEEKWDDVLNSKIWDLKNVGDLCADWKTIIPALRLSYHDLSSDLKPLFAYCSLFPKDFMFDKKQLVLLWMAEGFLDRSNASMSPERLGHEYFEELLSRSFFQLAPNEESLFVMHDLMNDLATFVSGNIFLSFDNHMELGMEALAKYRHMSFIREICVGYQKFEVLKGARSLRTFMAVSVGLDPRWNCFHLSSRILFYLLPQLPLLRVLSLSHFRISEVPDFIGSLKHLRYLNLCRTEIIELPENFLENQKVRHFDIRDTPLLKKLPLGIGELKCVQTLTKIIIGEESGFAIPWLKRLQHLHGEISIEGLHKVQSAMQAREANLSLKRLTKLQLTWDDDSHTGTLEKEVLNELKPNSDSLKELAIVSYGGVNFPNWVGDLCFHHLVHVSIRGCRKCTYLPPLGQLPYLKEIFIQGMDEVKVISSELTGTSVVAFPSLEILEFKDMCEWEVWSTNSDVSGLVFPCLRELHIQNCPKLINVSLQALPLLRVLEICGCGDGVLRSLVQAAPSVTKLNIMCISGLTNEVWRGVTDYLGALKELRIEMCDEIRYLWELKAEASKVLERKRRKMSGSTYYHLLRC